MTDKRPTVTLTGSDLTIDDIVAIGVGDKKVALSSKALQRCIRSRKFLEQEVKAKRIIYGVNTSFGPMCNKIIDDSEIEALQINLIKSHAAGLGEPLKPYIALAVMTVRLNSLVKGYSGVRTELLRFMAELINRGIAPYIPECGSVGASGDLVHLAHLGLLLIGEGEAHYQGRWQKVSAIFKKCGLKPFKLSFKEGLAIMNGTSAMTALAAFTLFVARKILNIACVNAAFAIEIFGGIDDAFDEDLHAIKPHPGQIHIASVIRSLYAGSRNITRRKDVHELIRKQGRGERVYETDINVQDVYSIRCTPQILAPVFETLQEAIKTVVIEANSSNDNPLIIPEKKKIIHGGNFHGESIAFAMDALSISLAKLCILSERRLNKLLDKKLNEGLPEFLISGQAGLNLGFMGAQYLATSTTAENKHLAGPVSIHSISCNASNQDVVSMGTIAARKAFQIASNAKHILTVEVLADLQALSFRNSAKMGKAISKVHRLLSKEFKVYDNTAVFHDSLVYFRKFLFSTQHFDDLKRYF